MKGNSDPESDKTEKTTNSGAASSAGEPVPVASNRNSLLQDWHKFIREFNYIYNQGFLTDSTRNRFCKAAVGSLQLLYDANSKDKRLVDEINIKAVIDSLKNAQSNLEIIHLFKTLPHTEQLKKLVRDKKIPMALGRLMSHVHGMYFMDLSVDSSKILPLTEFEYKKLIEVRNNTEITSGDFKARSSKEFIVFSALGVTLNVNDTKLRLSVAEDQFEKAWDLTKEIFLASASPVHAFKIINFKVAGEALKSFIEQYEKYNLEHGLSKDDGGHYQKQLREHERLIAGGQVTIYLPREMGAETYERITEMLEKVTAILRKNDIPTGVQPSSDRSLTPYVSGRVGGTEFDYISAADTTRNSSDPVLGEFAASLNRNKNALTEKK